MNWFKKQINRLFDSDIEDEDYYEEEFEELPAPPQKAEEKQLDDDLQNKRKSFKFPLIDDEDMELPQEPSQSFNGETQSDISRRFEEAKRETKHFYQPNAISKVYDVEVSGIRELLEKRQRIKGTSTVINRQESTRLRRVEKAKKQETVKNTFKNTATPTQRKQVEEEEPLEPKRKFVPTQVPSPVYGYKRPSNIDQLLLKKQEKAEEKPVKEENEPERKEILQDSAIEPKTFDEMPASDAKQGTSSPVVSKEHLQTYSAQIEEPIQQATVPSFLEIEDEVTVVVEEEPINLKEERYETVEELPILAEAVESSPIVEVQELQSLKPADTIVYAAANQEAAVTVYEEEITEVVEKLPEPIQVEEQESELPTVVEQQDEPLFHEKLESVEEIIEEQEDEASIEEVVNAIAEEIPSQEIEQRSIQEEINVISPDTDYRKIPIQSTQVQKLVSIALRDSELEEDTEIEAQQMQQEKLAEPAQQKPSQVLGVQDYVEAYTEPFEVTETFAPERGEGETSPSEEGEEVQEKPQSTGTTLPFNVLMLKSDKEKYAAKLAQKQMLHHNDDIKEMFRQTTKDEVQQSNSEIQEELEPASTNIETNEQVESKHEYPTMDREEVQLREDQDVVKYAEPEPVSIHEEADETPIEVEVDSVEEKKPPKIYVKPSLDFLSPPEEKTEDREWLESQADVLVESLSYFQVTAQVESITQGPAVTQFEITVGHGTKVSKVRNLSDDLKLALAAKDIRIQAPIPGKSTIGIEIPNRISRAVQLSEVTCSDSFSQSESPLEAALGLDLTGRPVTIDLRKMPHGLIAGATGSGKSVCINSILISLLYKADPNELKLLLIDPKMVELAPFNHIPHLVSPVITDV
ncbi:MAG TPA: DNA translocase FtsK, partial [Ureibacillus sp.]|nr:DNA translocase FtsK [Ureibacillus sp.]